VIDLQPDRKDNAPQVLFENQYVYLSLSSKEGVIVDVTVSFHKVIPVVKKMKESGEDFFYPGEDKDD
jgi:hypothetical protein